jgi:hypothetical protein
MATYLDLEKVITRRNTIVVMMLLGPVALTSHDELLNEPKASKTNPISAGVTQALGTLSRNCEGLLQCTVVTAPGRYGSEARTNTRAGHSERGLETRAGQVRLKGPRYRASQPPSTGRMTPWM